MGRPTWNAVGLQDDHRKAMSGSDRPGAEATETRPDHEQIGIGATARDQWLTRRHRGWERRRIGRMAAGFIAIGSGGRVSGPLGHGVAVQRG